jgi:hypothetical protein
MSLAYIIFVITCSRLPMQGKSVPVNLTWAGTFPGPLPAETAPSVSAATASARNSASVPTSPRGPPEATPQGSAPTDFDEIVPAQPPKQAARASTAELASIAMGVRQSDDGEEQFLPVAQLNDGGTHTTKTDSFEQAFAKLHSGGGQADDSRQGGESGSNGGSVPQSPSSR